MIPSLPLLYWMLASKIKSLLPFCTSISITNLLSKHFTGLSTLLLPKLSSLPYNAEWTKLSWTITLNTLSSSLTLSMSQGRYLIPLLILIKFTLLLSHQNSENFFLEILRITSNFGTVPASSNGLFIMQSIKTLNPWSLFCSSYANPCRTSTKNQSVIQLFCYGEWLSKCLILKGETFLTFWMMTYTLLNCLVLRVVHGYRILVTPIHFALEPQELLPIILQLKNIG